MVEYTSQSAMYFMGFGQPPDAPAPLDAMHSTPETSPFYASLVMTADAIGFELEDYRYEREVGLAEETFVVKAGTIEQRDDRGREDGRVRHRPWSRDVLDQRVGLADQQRRSSRMGDRRMLVHGDRR